LDFDNKLQQEQKMELHVPHENQRRWGIVAVAVLMFFVTMVITGVNGSKTSIYYWVWTMVGWYGFKGNLQNIKTLMKFLIILNLFAFLLILLFFDDQTVGYISKGGNSQVLAISVLVMLMPKIFMYMYCNKEINEGNQIGIDEQEEINRQEIAAQRVQSDRVKYKNIPTNSQSQKVKNMEDTYKRITPETDSSSDQKIVKPDSKRNSEGGVIINEDQCWEEALNEYDSNRRNNGLWARLYVENNAVEEQIKIAYIKTRANQIIEERKKEKLSQLENAREEKGLEKEKQESPALELQQNIYNMEFIKEFNESTHQIETNSPQKNFELGMIFYNGNNEITADHKSAFDFIYKGAVGGIREAQFNLSLMYWKGDGVEKSKSKAMAWAKIAAVDLDDAKENTVYFSKNMTKIEMKQAEDIFQTILKIHMLK